MEEPEGRLTRSKALRTDGRHVKIHPWEVQGRYARLQKSFYPALIAIYAAAPWIRVHGAPLIFIDIERRRFYLFGQTFNSTDFYLAFFVLSGVAFSLVVVSALFGRMWCGWACPQTVFLEAVYRKIEALVEGNARKRAARDAGDWTVDRVVRLGIKHLLFMVASLLIAHLFLSYFSTMESVLDMIQHSPTQHWVAFTWVMSISAILYFNFAWFREQLCLVICPYGRMQSVLFDSDTIVIGYDSLRGEPRGHKGTAGAGDCVACERCVTCCPTGIDIRNGVQMECIGCAHCIDACNEVMVKIGRPQGLIRFDSQAGLEHKPRRFFRPRLVAYGVAAAAGVVAMTLGIAGREPFEAKWLRPQTAPSETSNHVTTHRFVLHVTSKSGEQETLDIRVAAPAGTEVVLPMRDATLKSFESRHIPVMVVHPEEAVLPSAAVTATVTDRASGYEIHKELKLLGVKLGS